MAFSRAGMPSLIRSRSSAAAFQPGRRHLGPQLQVVDLDAVHLGHVHVVAGRVEVVRVVGPAEEAGGAALADDVALLQRPRHHHERQHRHGRRLEPDDVASRSSGSPSGVGGSSWPDGLTLSAV